MNYLTTLEHIELQTLIASLEENIRKMDELTKPQPEKVFTEDEFWKALRACDKKTIAKTKRILAKIK